MTDSEIETQFGLIEEQLAAMQARLALQSERFDAVIEVNRRFDAVHQQLNESHDQVRLANAGVRALYVDVHAPSGRVGVIDVRLRDGFRALKVSIEELSRRMLVIVEAQTALATRLDQLGEPDNPRAPILVKRVGYLELQIGALENRFNDLLKLVTEKTRTRSQRRTSRSTRKR